MAQTVNYWEVKLDPQPNQAIASYRFTTSSLVWDSINITWGKFPQHERPVLDPNVSGDVKFCRSYTIRDHSGTKIGTCEWITDTILIHDEPTHF